MNLWAFGYFGHYFNLAEQSLTKDLYLVYISVSDVITLSKLFEMALFICST